MAFGMIFTMTACTGGIGSSSGTVPEEAGTYQLSKMTYDGDVYEEDMLALLGEPYTMHWRVQIRLRGCIWHRRAQMHYKKG